MVHELIHDPLFLGKKARPATREDLTVGADLLETLLAHRATCVGMAGNMIGQAVAVIAFFDGDKPTVMYNPEILKAEGVYDTEEGCLSLLGGPRKTKRFQKIKVRWDNADFQKRIKTFSGWTAQIIQHEVDHCNGILI
jgi:peptide deformylase